MQLLITVQLHVEVSVCFWKVQVWKKYVLTTYVTVIVSTTQIMDIAWKREKKLEQREITYSKEVLVTRTSLLTGSRFSIQHESVIKSVISYRFILA